MSRAVKSKMVTELRERYGSAGDCAVCGFEGTTAGEFVEIRAALAEKGIRMHVVRNRLVKLALDRMDRSSVTALLEGPCAIATSADVDPVEFLKAVTDNVDKHAKLSLRGAMVEGQTLDAEQAAHLARIPSREILYAMIGGGIVAPVRQVAGAFASLARALCYALSAHRDKLQGSS